MMGKKDLKLGWCHLATVNEDKEVRVCEEGYERMLVGYEKLVGKSTFGVDRDVVQRAV